MTTLTLAGKSTATIDLCANIKNLSPHAIHQVSSLSGYLTSCRPQIKASATLRPPLTIVMGISYPIELPETRGLLQKSRGQNQEMNLIPRWL